MTNKLTFKTTLINTALSLFMLLGCKPVSLNVIELDKVYAYEEGEADTEFADELHKAALEGDLDKIEFFMEEGLKIDIKDSEGKTALHYACISDKKDDNLALVQILIEKIRIDERDKQGNTALQIAYNNQCYEIVKFLLEQKDTAGRTVLHLACIQGNEKMIDIVLQHSPETQLLDNDNHTPLYYAIEGKHTDAITVLKEKGAKLSDDEQKVKEEAEEKAAILLILKSNDLSLDNTGKALCWAVRNDQLDVIKWLIHKGGANLGKNGYYTNTPLHLAAERGYVAVAEVLIKAGANVNEKTTDKYGYTPLHSAVRNGETAVAELLIKSGANLNAKNNNEDTPLHIAAWRRETAVAELLIKSGANLNAKNNNEDTPLHIAAWRRETAVAELLVKSGANVNAKNKNGKTPFEEVDVKFGVNDCLLKLYTIDMKIGRG
jgi:ankyrin repeat protein